jgi:hypothetical protein
MPTSIPGLGVNGQRTTQSRSSGAIWLLAAWVIVMLLVGALQSFGTAVQAMDQFELLARF